jgi:hypothetical protein
MNSWVWICAVPILAIGCGDDGGDPDQDPELTLFPDGPLECGDLMCSAKEICVEKRASPFFGKNESEITRACAPPPSGCDRSDLCDCELETFDGLAVQGCFNFGGPTLSVVDANCGDRICTEQEGCLAQRELGGGFVPLRCVPLPSGCSRNTAFCDTNCATRLVQAQGLERITGCFSSDWMVGAYVD